MKNKKISYSVIGIIVSTIIFSVSAISVMANTSGFDRYKKALINFEKVLVNSNLDLNATIYLNENKILESTFINNINDTASYYETNYTIYPLEDDPSTEFHGYYTSSDGSTSYKSNGESQDYNNTFYKQTVREITASQEKVIDILLDSLIGDTKNLLIIDGNNISTSLSNDQLPSLVNPGLELLTEQFRLDFESYSDYTQTDEIDIERLLLLNNLKIDKLDFNGKITDNNEISYFNFDVDFVGYNENNQYTVYNFKVECNINNIGNAIVTKP